MKNTKVLIAILILVVLIAAFFHFTKNTGTIPKALKDFSIEDTAKVDKIFIADAKGNTITLNKKDEGWIVNDKYAARFHSVELLLETFHRIRVKSPVGKSALDNVIKRMATTAVKVEVYQGGQQPVKTYYVGGATMDHEGTYMLLERDGKKSSIPFVIYMPGFHGYLTTRFFTEEKQWRDPVIFKYKPEKIKRIKVEYIETPESSFVIESNNSGNFSLLDENSLPVKGVNKILLEEYVSRYAAVYYELVDEESPQTHVDSVLSSPPYFSIEVTNKEGVTNKIVAYHMPNFKQVLDNKGDPLKYDINRMYGYLNDEFFTFVQFVIFDPLSVPISYFMAEGEVVSD